MTSATYNRVRRVLIADDEPTIRHLLELNLRAEGLDVVVCEDGDSAYAAARSAPPDLFILDVMMPGRDGLDLLRDLRCDPLTANVPVVLLTAKATDAEVWEGWTAGADYYITKPFDLEEVLTFIRYLGTPGSE
ncbi:response regulator transcription factor [Nitriliruptor alkaliphilus]|uniref:response regulator transcription factor n=1 Tax=Nitriliruptor alkaliphilus TaxID=427918 RepID=UPI0006983906|nr:response regulator [Nitriliruptor alkaliphilus]